MTDFKYHDICPECESVEIPISTMDGGEEGLTDYFFSCSQCDFSWYVAVRAGASVSSDFAGFLGEDGNLSWVKR
tara:strand:+ start:471 stop:692 length:222 start_codon:yes stop_codon:yes gene_type:complete